jgi:hypothetical protein
MGQGNGVFLQRAANTASPFRGRFVRLDAHYFGYRPGFEFRLKNFRQRGNRQRQCAFG